jgi:predicted RNase H-like nuclease (RuvC/YqgF family)
VEAREAGFEAEVRKLKGEVAQARAEVSQLQGQLSIAAREAEDRVRLATPQTGKPDSSYYATLEQNYQQERERNRLLES